MQGRWRGHEGREWRSAALGVITDGQQCRRVARRLTKLITPLMTPLTGAGAVAITVTEISRSGACVCVDC